MIGDLFRRPARASGPPIPIVPDNAESLFASFGPGAMHQPQAEILLRENLGISDAANRAIGNRLATLTPQITRERRVTEGTTETEVIDDHPLAALLKRPHPNLSYRQLMRLTGQWIGATGEAYWVKVGNGFGVPAELHPLPPGFVDPIVRGGVIEEYSITDANGRQFRRPADTIVRIWFPDPENPWRARGILGPAALQLDGYKFASEHLRKHYQHDATPKVVLEGDREATAPPPVDSPDWRRFVRHWLQTYSARLRDREGGVPRILMPGYKAHELSGSADAATRTYLDFWRDDLLMAFGVPRSVLGQVVSGDRSSAEVNQWVFDLYAVMPVAMLIADAVTLQLASDFETDVEMGFAPFVASDKEFDLKREEHDLEHGVRTINKVLTDREDDTVPWGEKPTVKNTIKAFDPNAPDPRQVATPGNAVDPQMPDGEDNADRLVQSIHAQVRMLHRMKKRKARTATEAA